MTPAVEQLVRETMEVTGAQEPELLREDAPVLAADALAEDGGFYLVGLIGGKEVGKSALVNALAGRRITAVSSHGPGTEVAVAYAHASQERPLRELLERELPGEYRIVAHQIPELRSQVLLDLPDIDSRFESHLRVTRTMLRHMLYPVWVGSVEKYADRQPQQMLAKVAAGNAPENFLFCLNKVDQVEGSGGNPEEGARGGDAGTRGRGDAGITEPGASATGQNREGARGRGGEGAKEDGETGGRGDGGKEDDAGTTQSAVFSSQSLPLSTQSSALSTSSSHPMLDELRSDYAERVRKTLGLGSAPRVFLVSAAHPSRYDLPGLRKRLERERPAETVQASRQQAARRQDQSLLRWLDRQDLPARAKGLARLQEEAEELVAERVGAPVLEEIVPRLEDDPATRAALAEELLQERVARWPLVNLAHTLLAPLFVLARGMVSRHAGSPQSAAALVDGCIRDSGRSVGDLVQAAFAQVRQTSPALADVYAHNRLWEDMGAAAAAGELRRALVTTLERQRERVRQEVAGAGAALAAPLRLLLTVGALLWFPFVQPVLKAALADPDAATWRRLAGLAVTVLGVDYLLKSAVFLLIYFAVLWLALRWRTQRRVNRLLARWRSSGAADPSVNLADQAVEWMNGLLDPIRRARERVESLAERADKLRKAEAPRLAG